MQIGYARVSRGDSQDLDPQLRALTDAGCSIIYQEEASGAKSDRPELALAIEALKPGDVLTGAEFAPEAEAHMVRHMNEDHVDAMRDYCRMIGVDCGEQEPRMAAVDTRGFALFVGKRMLRFEFDAPATTPTDVRKALVAMAQQARASA